MTDIPIKDAATVILTRQSAGGLQVLMGQRGQGAAFMPNKFVFPGGAVDPEDYGLFDAKELEPTAARRLCHDAAKGAETACAAAAVRELWEETGLALAKGGTASPPPNMPPSWQSFAAAGHRPALDALFYVFRAITPPGRPRRFDARFFWADARCVAGDATDFSGASGELSHLQWVGLSEARALALPFITEVVLAEVEDLLLRGDFSRPASRPVPFFDNRAARGSFVSIP